MDAKQNQGREGFGWEKGRRLIERFLLPPLSLVPFQGVVGGCSL
jgi:hypothetical protein